MTYTHDEAASIIEAIEDVLIENGIRVPSPEDDERDSDDCGFYGSVYSDLLDYVEERLLRIIEAQKAGEKVVSNDFSGNF